MKRKQSKPRHKKPKKPKRFKRKEFRKLMDIMTDDPKRPKVKYKDPDKWRG